MNNVIMRTVAVGVAYAPLVSTPLVCSCCISCPPGNAASVNFKGDDGSDVPWIPGQWHLFKSVDLHAIQVKGNVGDTVTIVGGTW